MKFVDKLNYRDWQKRNTENFALLTKSQQKEARELGYHNLGWGKVIKSWEILCQLQSLPPKNTNVSSLFEYKLNRRDVVGAIDLSLIEVEQAKNLARETLKSIEESQNRINELTDKALAKYLNL